MAKTNKFFVKKYEEDKSKITVEEERKYRSPFILFLVNNGRLILTISLLLSISVFIIGVTLILNGIKDSSIVMYEENGVVVSFDGDDNSILNGTPITKEYADKVFDSNLTDYSYMKGVVIKIKEDNINGNIIMYYSDKTVIIRNKDGSFTRIYPVNGKYGVSVNDKDIVIDSKAITKDLNGTYKNNEFLGINIIYLSDGSVIVIKDDVNFFVRNSDITNGNLNFITNLSGVSVPTKKEDNRYYYSDGTIKEDDYIIVDNIKYTKIDEKEIHDNIKIIYYDNGYAEVIHDDMIIMVRNSEHIKYNDNIFEIIDNTNDKEIIDIVGNNILSDKEIIDIKDIMDIKEIKLDNKNLNKANYIIVLEETDDYRKHKVTKRLSNEYINYNVFVNGTRVNNMVLDNKLNNVDVGIDNKNNNYL